MEGARAMEGAVAMEGARHRRYGAWCRIAALRAVV
jgi:hypothetical protein